MKIANHLDEFPHKWYLNFSPSMVNLVWFKAPTALSGETPMFREYHLIDDTMYVKDWRFAQQVETGCFFEDEEGFQVHVSGVRFYDDGTWAEEGDDIDGE